MTKKKKTTAAAAKKKAVAKKPQAKKTTIAASKKPTKAKKSVTRVTAKKATTKKGTITPDSVLSLQTELLAASDRCNALAEEVVIGQAEHANTLDELSQDKRLTERLLEKKVAHYREHLSDQQKMREQSEHTISTSEHMIALLNGELEILRDELTLLEGRYQGALNTLVGLNARTQALEEAAAQRVLLAKENSDLKWYLGEEKAARIVLEENFEENEISIHGLEKELATVQEDLVVTLKQKSEFEWYHGEAQSTITTLEEKLYESHTHSQNLLQQIADMQESLTQTNLLAAKWMGRCDELLQGSENKDGGTSLEDLVTEMELEDQLAAAQAAVQHQKALEEELEQVKSERDSVLEVNAYLQDELVKEKEKSSALKAQYDEVK